MKAICKLQPGLGFGFKRDAEQSPLKHGGVRIAVTWAAVCATDMHIHDWTPWARARVKTPVVLGHECSGRITELGEGVPLSWLGKRVAVESHQVCGHCVQCHHGNGHLCESGALFGVTRDGAFAEYAVVPESSLIALPDSISDIDAALLEPMGAAVHGVDRAQVGGKSLLVVGCGPIGLMSVGAAKGFGASCIAAADPHPQRRQRASDMGADILFDSTDKQADPYTGVAGRAFDAAINCSDSVNGLLGAIRSVRKGGVVVSTGLPQESMTLDVSEELFYREVTLMGVSGRLQPRSWQQCFALLRNGEFNLKPVYGHHYVLEEIGDAIEDLRSGASGKPLIKVGAEKNVAGYES